MEVRNSIFQWISYYEHCGCKVLRADAVGLHYESCSQPFLQGNAGPVEVILKLHRLLGKKRLLSNSV